MSNEAIQAISTALREHSTALAAYRKSTEAGIEQVKSEIEKKSTEHNSRLFELEQLAVRDRDGGPWSYGEKRTPLDGFLKSQQLDAMRSGAQSTGRVELKHTGIGALQRKAITSADVGVPPQRAEGIFNNPQAPLSLLALLPTIPVSSGTFEFMQLQDAGNAAAVQANEGDLKAESKPVFETRTARIATVAHWVRASLQVLSDSPALERQVSDLMAYGALSRLEAQVLSGDGTGSNILGLALQANEFTPTVAHPVDRIGQAVTVLQAEGWNPTAIVMHPTDWFGIKSERAEGDGQYIMGSPRDPAGKVLWDLPVVTSAGMAQGTSLVLDTAHVALLDRQQPTVMASREDRDNFVTNQVTLLAEVRAGLAVLSRGAVLSVPLK